MMTASLQMHSGAGARPCLRLIPGTNHTIAPQLKSSEPEEPKPLEPEEILSAIAYGTLCIECAAETALHAENPSDEPYLSDAHYYLKPYLERLRQAMQCIEEITSLTGQ